jgi:FAD/FMN-containing dehydrogenase
MQRYSLALARRAVQTTTRKVAPAQIRFASALPPRSQAFAELTESNVKDLRGLLSSPTSLMSTLDGTATMDDLKPFNDDWMNKYHGKGQVVVKPKTVEEVSKIMKYCWDNGIAVVPQGGNTGLVGELQTLPNLAV